VPAGDWLSFWRARIMASAFEPGRKRTIGNSVGSAEANVRKADECCRLSTQQPRGVVGLSGPCTQTVRWCCGLPLVVVNWRNDAENSCPYPSFALCVVVRQRVERVGASAYDLRCVRAGTPIHTVSIRTDSRAQACVGEIVGRVTGVHI
jgi:hypothetical protein